MTRITRTRLVATAALEAASAAGLTACTAAAEPAAEKTAVAVADASTEAVLQQNRLSVESAMTAAQAALAQCQADGLGFVSVAVVDRYGQTQALIRGDNAAVHTLEVHPHRPSPRYRPDAVDEWLLAQEHASIAEEAA